MNALPDEIIASEGVGAVFKFYNAGNFITPFITLTPATQTTKEFRFPKAPNALYYRTTRMENDDLGFVQYNDYVPYTVVDQCTWFDQAYNPLHATSSTVLPCNSAGTQSCNLLAANVNDICQCKSIYDDFTFEVTQYYGQFCQYKLTLPGGPYYIGQRVKIIYSLFNAELYGTTIQNNALKSFELHDVSGVKTPIIIQPFASIDINTNIHTYIVEIPNTVIDTGRQPQLQTPEQISSLMHYKWVIKSTADASSIIPGLNTNRGNKGFRIVEPCYWTQLTQYQTQCSNKVDSKGNYVAVESCINPLTHAIECQCKEGYFFSECRYEFNMLTPPITVNSVGVYYHQQPLKISTQWYSNSLDIGHRRSPSKLELSFASTSTVDLTRSSSFYNPITDHWVFNAEPDLELNSEYAFGGLYDLKILAPSTAVNQNNIPHWPVHKKIQVYRWGNPYDGIEEEGEKEAAVNRLALSTAKGLESLYGVKCPSNNVTPYGCRCGHNGVFGPNCGFKIDFYPNSNHTRFALNYVWFPYQTYSYSITTIKPITALPAGSKHASLPSKWHFELRNKRYVDDNYSPEDYYFSASVPLPPSPPNTLTIPTVPEEGEAALFMVSDDPEDNGMEYWIRNLFIEDSDCPVDRSSGPGPNTIGTNQCLCIDGFYGLECQYKMTLPKYKFQLDSVPAEGTVPPINLVLPTNNIEAPLGLVLYDAYMSGIPHTISNARPVQHTLSYDSTEKTLTYNGQLDNYSGKSTRYTLFLRFAPVGAVAPIDTKTLVTHTVFQPLTVVAGECSSQDINNSHDCTPTVDIPTLFDVELQFGPKPVNHLTSPIITVTYPGTAVTVTIPVYNDFAGKALIQLHTYPIDGNGVYSAQSIAISAVTSAISPLSSSPRIFPYPIPSTLVASKLFYTITFPPLSSTSTERLTVVSPLFSTVAKCFKPPTNIQNHANINAWLTSCSSNGQCSNLTQECRCSAGFEGKLCDNVIQTCTQCPKDHISSCTTSDQCICKSEWGGDNCQVAASCAAKSSKQCNGDNGYLAPSTQAGKCSNTCICNNQWTGLRCQSCSVQCANGGEPFNSCDKCGCLVGFLPPFCQCQAVTGDISINGWNEALIRHHQLKKNAVANADLKNTAEYIDMEVLASALTEAVNWLLGEYMQLNQSTLETELMPVYDGTGTKMTVKIKFGCEEFNKALDLEKLKEKWTLMVNMLSTDEAFRSLFTFPVDKPLSVVDVRDLEEVEESLPDGDDKLQNNHSINLPSSLYSLFLISLLFLFMI